MATLETHQLDEIISSRRNMIALGGAALAGLALTSAAKAQTTTLTDADYLNFALNLEYLEAQFYTLATVGSTIDALGVGVAGTGSPAVAAGSVTVKNANSYASCKVAFSNPLISSYATETAAEERKHVSFLRNALGTAAVAQPNIDLVNSFNTLAAAAGIGPAFDPFVNDVTFLLGAYIFEDVGVTAYTGAAPLLTSAANLDAAAGIQAVEAYHAGVVRTALYTLDQQATALGPAGTASAIASKISHLRALVDGANSITSSSPQGDDIGLGTQLVALEGSTATFSASTIVNANTTGSLNTATANATAGSLCFTRTPTQVLAIVYAGSAGTPNGFFPNGLNGKIK